MLSIGEPIKPPIPTESEEQAVFCDWLRAWGVSFFSVPNGARVRPSQARKLKREGMTPGVPDIILIQRASDGRSVAIEMKRSKGGVVSPEQKSKHAEMRRHGWLVIVAKGAQDAIKQTTELL